MLYEYALREACDGELRMIVCAIVRELYRARITSDDTLEEVERLLSPQANHDREGRAPQDRVLRGRVLERCAEAHQRYAA